jgi:hypothetical protein
MDTPIWATCVCSLTRWGALTLEILRLARPRVDPVDPASPTDKAFNATTSTNVATTPSAWERRLRLVLLFTTHTGMGDEKQPLFPP